MFPQIAAAAAGLKTAAGGIALALAFTAGATFTWTGTWFYVEHWTLPAARTEAEAAGRAASDREWQTKLDEANAAAEAERATKQIAIDRVTRSYLKLIGDRDAAMTALEAQLSEERRDNAFPLPTPSPGAAGACRPALSGRVSKSLDGVGRASLGDDPGRPDATMSGRR